jgi:hypothetical protein
MAEIDMTQWLKKNPAAFASIKDSMVVDQSYKNKLAGEEKEDAVTRAIRKEKSEDEREERASKRKSGLGPAGRAMSFDPEGGMRPGQSPSLENPLREKKGGSIKKKYAAGGKINLKSCGVSTAEKRNPKNSNW